jgi:hypothetical protein
VASARCLAAAVAGCSFSRARPSPSRAAWPPPGLSTSHAKAASTQSAEPPQKEESRPVKEEEEEEEKKRKEKKKKYDRAR